jgi:hypothetical protein
MDTVSAAWARDEERVRQVRAMEGRALETVLKEAIGDRRGGWWGAYSEREVSLAAVYHVQRRHADRIENFAQRLVDEVDGEAVV